MDANLFSEFAKVLLPVSTPLNLVLFAALYWLARDRDKICQQLIDVQHELISEKDKRSEMLLGLHGDEAERADGLAKVLAEFTARADQVLRRVP